MSTLRLGAHVALSMLGFVLAGCVSEDEAILFVEPSVVAPEAKIAGMVFGLDIGGSFQLKLALGPRASGPSEVLLGSTAITDAENKQSIVPSLSLILDKALPVKVEPGSEVTVGIIFDTGGKVLPEELEAALCAPAGVRIAGTIKDSLEDSATPFSSSPFQPKGCP